MQYPNGERIELGDTVSIDMPDGWQEARVVMLGGTREHLNLDQELIDWFGGKGMESTEILVQWLEDGEPRTGRYMTTHVSCCINLISRCAP